jgi:cytidylate kinase
MIIAIDGFSSCGKSTLAKALAQFYDFIFIDTGAMYRAVALYFLRHEVDLENQVAIKEALENIHLQLDNQDGNALTYLNGEDVSKEIRQRKVADIVSDVAKIDLVRTKMVEYQRKMSKDKSVVMDGRDIGTVVFPEADVKFFVTATIEERSKRRFLELKQKGIMMEIHEVQQNLLKRDHIDSTRKNSPLKRAVDAFLIDNTYLSQEEQLDLARKVIEDRTRVDN